jgi:hypothetical protein
MTIGYHAVNSITSQGPILAGYFPIRGNITFRPSGGSFNIDFYGVRYSSLEIWQYRRYDRYAVNRGGFSQGSPIADANLFSTSRSIAGPAPPTAAARVRSRPLGTTPARIAAPARPQTEQGGCALPALRLAR